ncbi:PA3371 family protein [Pseudomonas huanghezhanensis]|uniref:PA3371 family protein n=1 Tax=Pseudomonas huanghezhanensis TaxID=3002903 RepID=UPI00228566EA|nr:PA3371 family protein [Pseudomonas sp. BSw22131]
MSKAALSFLVLAIMAVAANRLIPVSQAALSIATILAAVVFVGLFLGALFVGRKIKFDPVLRQMKQR